MNGVVLGALCIWGCVLSSPRKMLTRIDGHQDLSHCAFLLCPEQSRKLWFSKAAASSLVAWMQICLSAFQQRAPQQCARLWSGGPQSPLLLKDGYENRRQGGTLPSACDRPTQHMVPSELLADQQASLRCCRTLTMLPVSHAAPMLCKGADSWARRVRVPYSPCPTVVSRSISAARLDCKINE